MPFSVPVAPFMAVQERSQARVGLLLCRGQSAKVPSRFDHHSHSFVNEVTNCGDLAIVFVEPFRQRCHRDHCLGFQRSFAKCTFACAEPFGPTVTAVACASYFLRNSGSHQAPSSTSSHANSL